MESREAASFRAVWDTLGLAGTHVAPGATMTPESLARAKAGLEATVHAPKASPEAGLSLATLPPLSIAERDAGCGGSVPGVGDHDIVITGTLGEGGMGRVLLARQRSLSRDVAVKTVHERARSADADALVTEGLITGHLEHPNITPVHQLGVDQAGRPLLVMKRIVGVAWDELIHDPDHAAWARIPTLPTDRLLAHLEILMQVCNGLSFAHSRSVVHRDVKPENVMIGEFGEVYLCDWGIGVKVPIAKGRARGLVGTPSYLAPEMLDLEAEVTPSLDVYLLGGTLHTILTGRPRHEGHSLEDVLEAAHASEPFRYDASIEAELADLANRATAREPRERPASALAFRREIADYLSHRTSIALSETASELYAALEAHVSDLSRDRAQSSRASTECRFAYAQALREWPENPAAKRGLQRCLGTSVRLEIEGENLGVARSLLDEMEDPPPALVAEVESLAARLAARAADAEKLRVLQREGDLAVASKPRSRLMAILLGVGISMSIGGEVVRRSGGDPDSAIGHVVFISIILSAASLGTFVWRRDLLVNQVNRRTAAIVLGSMALEWLHAVESYATNSSFIESHRSEMFIVAASTATASLLIDRQWAIASVILVIGSIVACIFPSLTLPVFVVGHMSILLVLASINRSRPT